jgi:hypothetical protein
MTEESQEKRKSNPATGASVRKHPSKDEIDERLLAGESVEAVANWLKQKFSKNKKLWVNKMTLNAYRQNFLNLEGEVLADLKKERKVKLDEEKKRRAVEVAHAEPAYQVAKAKYAENYALQISNTNQRLEEIYFKLQERLTIMEGEKIFHLNEKVITEQLNAMRAILKDAFDMEQKLKNDQQTNVNIDIGRITREIQIIKTALRETICELCPDIWSTFMDKMSEKMQAARIDEQQFAEEVEDNDEDDEDDTPKVNINIKA